MVRSKGQRLLLASGCVIIFIVGLLFSVWSRSNAHNQLREQLFYTVDLAIAATDPDVIESLRAEPEDATRPEYIRLYDQYLQLQSPLQQKYIRWIYAMKVFPDEEVRFIVDSVTADDPGHSEPGVVYEQPPASVVNVLRTGKAEFIGPFTDEYGSYYSVFAPMYSTRGGIIAVMGADIEKEVYEGIIRQRSLLPIIVSLFVEALFILTFLYIVRRWEVEQMKSQFVSIASHQLKTPITALNWMIELLEQDKATKSKDSLKEKIHDLKIIVHGMRELVNSLLNVSRVDAGRIAVQTKPTNLGDLVHERLSEVAMSAKNKNQHVSVHVDSELPLINIDAALVGEVYKNLLTNAIKYTPQGGRIDVSVTQKGSEVLSVIKDTGYGIPEHEQGRVFEKFYRGSNIVQIEHDGTGLGLYLVKEVVKMSGGRIWFESQEGKGTAFYFTLPLRGSKEKKGELSIS